MPRNAISFHAEINFVFFVKGNRILCSLEFYPILVTAEVIGPTRQYLCKVNADSLFSTKFRFFRSMVFAKYKKTHLIAHGLNENKI